MITFRCHSCGKVYKVKPEHGGKTIRCPGCKVPVVLPTGMAAVTPPQAPVLLPISFQCQSCGKGYKVKHEHGGKTIRCPGCKVPVVLPTAMSPVTPPRAPATLPKPVALKQTGNIPQPLVQSTKPATNRTLVTSYDLSNQQLIKNERVTGGSKDVFVQKRIPAALFALFLFGPMGSHKFFLGQTTAGAIMAIMSTVGIAGACFVFPLALIVITSSIAIAEAIIYLSKSEDQFYIDYCINKKQWF